MKLIIVIKETFYALTVALLIFGAMEIIRPRIVLAYLNLSWLLFFWLAAAFSILLINKEK